MRAHRELLFAILVYVTLDLSLPSMPGAFVFDPGDSVESTQMSRTRGSMDAAPSREPLFHVQPDRVLRRPVAEPRVPRPAPFRPPASLPRASTASAPVAEEPH